MAMVKKVKSADVAARPLAGARKSKKKSKVLMPDDAFFAAGASSSSLETDGDDADELLKKKKIPSPFTQHLPPERTWSTAPVTEKSVTYVAWVKDCQALVDGHFGTGINKLITKVITNFMWITMQSRTDVRSFAFIEKKTGNIHCPALFDEPFTQAHGNIIDDVTRMSVMGPWGVHTIWSWLPTYPEGKHFIRPRK